MKKTLLYIPLISSLMHAEIPLYYIPSKEAPNPYGCLFAHGLWVNRNHAWLYSTENEWGMFDHTLFSFDFPDAQYGFNRAKVNLAQQADIDRLAQAHKKMRIKNPHITKTILCGVSRGAATIINYLGTTNQPLDDIEAVILESPFDTLNSVLDNIIKRYKLWLIPHIKPLAKGIVKKLYQEYKDDGIHPIDAIQQIPTHIPIILVHSKKDWFIPIDATRNLYLALKDAGHKHVYLIETPEGSHGKILWESSGSFYRNCIHAIFKHLGVPHNPVWAKKGNPHFDQLQPTWLEVYSKIAKS
jgi:pimeloyl-ACP methyl ester carboxylesterase